MIKWRIGLIYIYIMNIVKVMLKNDKMEDRVDIYITNIVKVMEKNDKVEDGPALINQSPEDEGWLCRFLSYYISKLLFLVQKSLHYLRDYQHNFK